MSLKNKLKVGESIKTDNGYSISIISVDDTRIVAQSHPFIRANDTISIFGLTGIVQNTTPYTIISFSASYIDKLSKVSCNRNYRRYASADEHNVSVASDWFNNVLQSTQSDNKNTTNNVEHNSASSWFSEVLKDNPYRGNHNDKN